MDTIYIQLLENQLTYSPILKVDSCQNIDETPSYFISSLSVEDSFSLDQITVSELMQDSFGYYLQIYSSLFKDIETSMTLNIEIWYEYSDRAFSFTR